MSNLDQEILIEQIKNPTTRIVDIHAILDKFYDMIREIQRQDKPSKAAKQYAEEEEAKLLFLQDTLKKAIWEAYPNDLEIIKKTMNWRQVQTHFEFELIVRQKEEKA